MVGGLLVLAGTAAFAANRLAGKQLSDGSLTDKQCLKYKAEEHIITVENGVASPSHINAMQCDHLTILNRDDDIRLMAFGRHDAHITYNGIEQQPLIKNQSFSVTLVKPGEFLIHDHEHDEVQATFTVKAR